MIKSDQKKKPKHAATAQTGSTLAFDIAAARIFSKDVLAPIMNEFMIRLHVTVATASAQGVQTLFCYRAGLRIFLMYREWLAARKTPMPDRVGVIKISRFAALKSAYRAAPDLALTGLCNQLPGHDLHDIVELILGEGLNVSQGRLPAMPLHQFITLDEPNAERLRTHLLDQSDLMSAYIERLVSGTNRILLIDSGWAGTTQLMLEQSCHDYSIEGAYFGVIGRTEILGKTPGRMHGLMFETENFLYNPLFPETAYVLHRHLIESLFEPNISSVSSIAKRDSTGPDIMPSDDVLRQQSCDWDQMFSLVLEDVRDQACIMPTTRESAYRSALNELTRVLTFPKRQDIFIAAGKYRSADLGRSIGVDPILEPRDRFEADNADNRITAALWPAGQAALEYENPRSVQEKLLTEHTASKQQNYFVSLTLPVSDIGDGKVAVITRTKNRPVLLRRAAESVAKQTYTNLEWVVVNDGGDLSAVRSVIDQSLADPSKITICHNLQSLGMEAASNAGIRNSNSEWIVIHDDDDSWHPDFLVDTTNFLRQNRGLYAGVITGTLYITEEIIGDKVIEHGKVPYQDWVKNVQLAEMATGNFFAPIAFVFERRIFDKVNGYDPKLPVLGDWDFNLRFLLEADIGVIDKKLAYYHHRPAAVAGSYSNSVVGGIDKHLSYNAIVRNKYIRESVGNPKMAALANLISTAYLHVDSRARFDSVHNTIAHVPMSKTIQSTTDLQSVLDDRWVMTSFLATKLEEFSQGKIKKDDILKLDRASIIKIVESMDITIPPDFDETAYLTVHSDVAKSVTDGILRSGFAHYIAYGREEGRDAVRK